MVWYEELGFDEDPFKGNALDRDDKLIGRKEVKADLVYRIESGSMLLIVGKEGVGKTMLLKHAIDTFKGKGKVIYVDGNKVNKRLNIEKLLIKGAGFLQGALLKQKPKEMILLMDNVQNLTLRNNKRIKYYFDQDYIKSVVFTTSDYGSLQFTDSIKDRIGKRVIKLRELTIDNILAIVRARLENKDILTDEIVKEIYAMSGKNLKTLMENCSKVCEYAFENGDEVVKREHITKALPKGTHELEIEPDTCDECGEELKQIGNSWLCPHCDTYCMNCGAHIHEDDMRCPSCGVEFEGDDDE